MRAVIPFLLLGMLGACAPEIPDSGIGFDSEFDARRARELQLAGQAPAGVPSLAPPAVVSSEVTPRTDVVDLTLAPRSAGSVSAANSTNSADIAAEAAAALAASSANSGQAPLNASPSNPPPVALSNPGISDENDFAAVAGRQTIQSDAERIAQNRAQYQVIQPTAVPTRAAGTGPNIVSYALSTSHARGTRIYSRSGVNLAARAQRACASYPSPDQAQIDFLEKGGPERDRLGLDPDGDGYACSWNPAPFRSAVKN